MQPENKTSEEKQKLNENIIFQPDRRSLRLYPMKKRDGSLPIDNLKLRESSGTAFLPIVKSIDELCKLTKALFGEPGYARFIKRYVFAKRFSFQNPYVPSTKIITILNQNDLIEYTDLHLNKIANNPSYTVTSNQNAVIDLTKIFEAILTEQPRFRLTNVFLSNAEVHLINIIRYFIDGYLPLGHDYLAKFQTSIQALKTYGYSNYIVAIPVEGKTARYVDSYLSPDTILSSIVKKDPILYSLSIIRLLIAAYANIQIDVKKQPELLEVIEFLKKFNLTFVFYNDFNFFFVNFADLNSHTISSTQFLQQIKMRLKLLIHQNNEAAEMVDEDAGDNVEQIIDQKDQSEDEVIQQSADIKRVKLVKVSKQPVDTNVSSDIRIANIIKNSAINKSTIGVTADKSSAITKPTPQPHQGVVDFDGEILTDDVEEEKDLNEEEFVPPEKESKDGAPVRNEMTEIVIDKEDEDALDLTPTTDPLVIAKRTIEPKRSPAQIRRIAAVREKYKSIRFDDKRTVEQVVNDVESLTIDNKPSKLKLRDESLNHSTLIDLERSYVTKTFPRDILSMAKSFSSDDKSIKLHITDFTKEDTSDQFNDRELWHINFEDENQKKHHLKFTVPKIDNNGFLRINGDTKILKKQWLMIPIAKIKPDTVFISSNLNKVILYRQGTTLNHNLVILSRLFKEFMLNLPGVKIDMGNNQKENKSFLTTVEYDEMSKSFHRVSIKTKETLVQVYFSQKEIRDVIQADKLIDYKISDKRMPFAISMTKGQVPKVIDMDPIDGEDSFCLNILSLIQASGVVPDFDRIITSIPDPKRKVYTRILMQSKKIPLVAFLGGLFGLKKVIDGLKNPAIVFSAVKNKMSTDSYIKFKNGFLYYPSYPLPISLILNGLSELETENYLFEEFETVTPYLDFLYDNYKNRNMMKGWTSFKELFLDPITLDVLRDFKLPTDFLEIFLYGNELLGDNSFTHETDASLYRVRGYEVIAVELYKAMAQQYITLKQSGFSRQSMTLPEDELIKRLHKSFILENYDSINPINELKSKSIVTFKGPNGVNESRAFPLEKRAYGGNMIGVIGMASVDSSNVGIVKQLSLNPRITSTRGYIDAIKDSKEANNLSFSQMATPEEATIPFINRHDDPKRVGFASGQTKHVISVSGSAPPLVGTGFEQSIIYKIGDTFAKKAKYNGRCISIDEKNSIAIIEYDNGEHDVVEYGRALNRNSNMYLGNPLALNVKLGQKVKAGEVLSYNSEFFARRGNRFFLKQGALCRLVVLEGEGTEDDSSDITETFAEMMTTDVIKRKQISIGAKANIISFKKLGEHVLHGDSLVIFEDSKDATGQTSSILDALGDIDERTLNSVTRHAPTANDTGEIVDVKMYWTVPIEEMSESCRKLVLSYIAREKEKIKFEEDATGKKSKRRLNIEVSTAYRNRIRGVEEDKDQGSVIVEYYIGGQHAMGAGDKLTYYSSLK